MIHISSVVNKNAKISKKGSIGPFCYVGPNVELSDGVELISNVHIEGNTKIEKNTKIFPFASIGTQPQDLKFKNEKNILFFISHLNVSVDVFFLHNSSNFLDLSFLIFIIFEVSSNSLLHCPVLIFDICLSGISNQLFSSAERISLNLRLTLFSNNI